MDLQANLRLLSTTAMLGLIFGLCNLGLAGCETSAPGVESNKVQQWVTVDGDVSEAADAAEEVLSDYDLKDVDAKTTAIDGTVTGKKADGTEVRVSISKVTDETSEVTVRVGTLGDNTLGTEIAHKIKKELAD